MSDAKKKPQSATRRGGLGRGLGALIPSGPLPGTASGKGHFWNALDNPPIVDEASVRSILDDPAPDSDAGAESTALDKTAGQSGDSADVYAKGVDSHDSDRSRTPVDIHVDTEALSSASEADSAGEDDAAEGSDAAGGHELAQPSGDGSAVSSEVSGAVATAGEDGADAGAPAAVLIEIDPNDVRANPKNPRTVFDEDELIELSESIKEFGLLQPIVVRAQGDGYELVMGERRLRASKLADVDLIPAIVRQTDDDEMLRDALLENIHRVQLHPLEEAAAYQQLIDEFGVTHEELAKRIKRSRPVISNSIRLLKLPARVQNRVAAGVISGSHARALLGLDDPEAQEQLATRIVAEGLSVRATEEAVALYAGEDQKPQRKARRKAPVAPALSALADRLSDHFDTRAVVQLGRTKGKIVVEFASVDDLERIVAMMAPPLATRKDEGTPGDAAASES